MRTSERTGSPFGRRSRPDDGFTLVEMMVVLLVLGVLMSVIVPTYRGARDRTQDRVAQLNLRSALVAAKISYADFGNYNKADTPADLQKIEPTLNLVTSSTASNAPSIISADGHEDPDTERNANVFRAAALSDSDICWFIWDDDDTGTRFGFVDLHNATEAQVTSECKADAADTTTRPPTGTDNTVSLTVGGTSVSRRICFYRDWQPIYDRGLVTCPNPAR